MVDIWQEKFPNLIYVSQEFRGGIDQDIEKVVSLARGRYCWLISADDIMLPESLAHLLISIKNNYDIYLCEHVLCDLEMNKICEYPPFYQAEQPRTFNLGDTNDKRDYFQMARTSEAFFSFMSSPIFKKSIWDKSVFPESFRGTCWIVAGHLLASIPEGVTIHYLARPLLHKRGENDSFSENGVVNRLGIAIKNFQHVGNLIFGKDSTEAKHIRRVLHQDVPLSALMAARYKAFKQPLKEDISVLDHLAELHYQDKNFNNYVSHLLYKYTPMSFVILLQKLRKRIGR